MKTIKLKVFKEKLENMSKEFDKKPIEFKIYEESDWDYDLRLYIGGEYKWIMCFNKDTSRTEKLSEFNKLIEIAIREYSGEDNFATQDDLNNEDLELWGIDLYSICVGKKVYIYSAFNIYHKYQHNCYSKTKWPIENIAKALKPVADYFDKAFKGESWKK